MSEAKTPEQLAKEGKQAYQRGDYPAAAALFEAARHGYTGSNEALNAAEMANNASVAYLQAGEAQAALQAAEGTAAIFAQAGDLRRQGMALGNLGSALEALARPDEALQAYQQSAEVLQQCGEDELRASVMQSISGLQFRTGRQLQALASMQDGLEGIKRPSPKQKFLKRLLRIPFEMLNKKSS